MSQNDLVDKVQQDNPTYEEGTNKKFLSTNHVQYDDGNQDNDQVVEEEIAVDLSMDR